MLNEQRLAMDLVPGDRLLMRDRDPLDPAGYQEIRGIVRTRNLFFPSRRQLRFTLGHAGMTLSDIDLEQSLVCSTTEPQAEWNRKIYSEVLKLPHLGQEQLQDLVWGQFSPAINYQHATSLADWACRRFGILPNWSLVRHAGSWQGPRRPPCGGWWRCQMSSPRDVYSGPQSYDEQGGTMALAICATVAAVARDYYDRVAQEMLTV